MKPRKLLALFIIPMGLIIAAVPQNKTNPYKLTAEEILSEVNTRTQYVTPDAVADMIVKRILSFVLLTSEVRMNLRNSVCPGQ